MDFYGRNGAGKSTIFRIILGIIKQDKGNITFNGEKIDKEIKNSIGYVPEEGSLNLQYTVLEQCIYYGSLKELSEKEIKENLIKWLEKFNIIEYMNTKIKDMSKGNRQKIQVIIALLHTPKLLILDEPFSGLDPLSVEEFKNVILSLKKEEKMIILSSHRMDQVDKLCDDILLIDKGKEILKGSLKEIKEEYRNKKNLSQGVDLEDIFIESVEEKEYE